jgi:predicted MFS family arabinose efflux permease
MSENQGGEKEDIYIGNIWGWKWSYISLAIILIVMLMAVCRYIIVQPDHLFEPEQTEEVG